MKKSRSKDFLPLLKFLEVKLQSAIIIGQKEYIPLENFEISASYDDSYKISIRASFGEALKIAEYLKEFYKTEKPDSL